MKFFLKHRIICLFVSLMLVGIDVRSNILGQRILFDGWNDIDSLPGRLLLMGFALLGTFAVGTITHLLEGIERGGYQQHLEEGLTERVFQLIALVFAAVSICGSLASSYHFALQKAPEPRGDIHQFAAGAFAVLIALGVMVCGRLIAPGSMAQKSESSKGSKSPPHSSSQAQTANTSPGQPIESISTEEKDQTQDREAS